MARPERRRQLHGWVTVEALEGFQRFADHHGTNVTALMEAIGRHLADLEAGPLPPTWKAILNDAQRVAGTRSSRVRRRQDTTDSET